MFHIYDVICKLLTYPLTSYDDMLQSLGEILKDEIVMGSFAIFVFNPGCGPSFCLLGEQCLHVYNPSGSIFDGHHFLFT